MSSLRITESNPGASLRPSRLASPGVSCSDRISGSNRHPSGSAAPVPCPLDRASRSTWRWAKRIACAIAADDIGLPRKCVAPAS
ncbi:hypothetical protein [Sphingomonas sp. 7/4-4]|uniref:hypothetical protein n=1 Tax=Sphingomonas sp. 7/4-4 TaxID=3018446 RepID=UPI00300DE2BB